MFCFLHPHVWEFLIPHPPKTKNLIHAGHHVWMTFNPPWKCWDDEHGFFCCRRPITPPVPIGAHTHKPTQTSSPWTSKAVCVAAIGVALVGVCTFAWRQVWHWWVAIEVVPLEQLIWQEQFLFFQSMNFSFSRFHRQYFSANAPWPASSHLCYWFLPSVLFPPCFFYAIPLIFFFIFLFFHWTSLYFLNQCFLRFVIKQHSFMVSVSEASRRNVLELWIHLHKPLFASQMEHPSITSRLFKSLPETWRKAG